MSLTLPSRSSELELFNLDGEEGASLLCGLTRREPGAGLDADLPSTATKLARTFDRLSEPAGDCSRGGGEVVLC